MDTVGRRHHLSKGLSHITAWCIWRCGVVEGCKRLSMARTQGSRRSMAAEKNKGQLDVIWQAAESLQSRRGTWSDRSL